MHHQLTAVPHLEQGGVGIPPSNNPDAPTFVRLAEDTEAGDNHILDHAALQAQLQADCNVKEACKRFLISRFELVYFFKS